MRSSTFAASAALVGAATASAWGAPGGGDYGYGAYTTEVVTDLTTFCPEATQVSYGGQTWSVSAPTYLTIPGTWTVTKPVSTPTPAPYSSTPSPTAYSSSPVWSSESSSTPCPESSSTPVWTPTAYTPIPVKSYSSSPVWSSESSSPVWTPVPYSSKSEESTPVWTPSPSVYTPLPVETPTGSSWTPAPYSSSPPAVWTSVPAPYPVANSTSWVPVPTGKPISTPIPYKGAASSVAVSSTGLLAVVGLVAFFL